MSTFYTNEDSSLSIDADMDIDIDDRIDDDLDDTADQPLNRPKVNFIPTRDPLVAALFGPVVLCRDENATEQECSMVS